MPREDSIIQERYDLTIERIASILQEHTVSEPFGDYFAKTASFLFMLHQADIRWERSLEEWQEWNRQLYEDILPENYGSSYGNPAYAVGRLGEVHGRILSFLYTELRGINCLLKFTIVLKRRNFRLTVKSSRLFIGISVITAI